MLNAECCNEASVRCGVSQVKQLRYSLTSTSTRTPHRQQLESENTAMATVLRDILSRRKQKAHGRAEREPERNDEPKQASSARQHQHQPPQGNTSGDGKDTNLNFKDFPGRLEEDPSRKHRIVQFLSQRYLIRRRLVILLEERFPGQWELQVGCFRVTHAKKNPPFTDIMKKHRMDTWIINIPAPLTHVGL